MLSRKPAPKVVESVDPVTGLSKMTIEDENDDEEIKKNQPTPEELRLRAQKEREEKQKRYDEARARILGTTTSGSSTLGTVTLPTTAEEGRANSRGKGRGGRQESRRSDSQSGTKELFDPNYTPVPGVTIQKRNGDAPRSGRSTPREEEQVIRAPRGPDGSGRGGFGFAGRGGKIS